MGNVLATTIGSSWPRLLLCLMMLGSAWIWLRPGHWAGLHPSDSVSLPLSADEQERRAARRWLNEVTAGPEEGAQLDTAGEGERVLAALREALRGDSLVRAAVLHQWLREERPQDSETQRLGCRLARLRGDVSRGDTIGAVEACLAAVRQQEPTPSCPSLFELALTYDSRSEDALAAETYGRCVQTSPAHPLARLADIRLQIQAQPPAETLRLLGMLYAEPGIEQWMGLDELAAERGFILRLPQEEWHVFERSSRALAREAALGAAALAEAALQEGRTDDALALVERAMAERPVPASIWLVAGRVALARGRPVEALERAERAMELAGDERCPTLLFRAEVYTALGSLRLAEDDLRSCVQRARSGREPALHVLDLALAEELLYMEIGAVLERAADQEPLQAGVGGLIAGSAWTTLQKGIRERRAAAAHESIRRMRREIDRGLPAPAMTHLSEARSRAAELFPGAPDHDARRAAHPNLGALERDAEEGGAAQVMSARVEALTHVLVPHILEAAEAGEVQRAEDLLGVAMQLAPAASHVAVAGCTIAVDARQYALALRRCTQAIELAGPVVSCPDLLNRVLALQGLGLWEQAERDLASCAAMEPDNAEVYFQRARARASIEDLAGTVALLEQAASLDPDWTAPATLEDEPLFEVFLDSATWQELLADSRERRRQSRRSRGGLGVLLALLGLAPLGLWWRRRSQGGDEHGGGDV